MEDQNGNSDDNTGVLRRFVRGAFEHPIASGLGVLLSMSFGAFVALGGVVLFSDPNARGIARVTNATNVRDARLTAAETRYSSANTLAMGVYTLCLTSQHRPDADDCRRADRRVRAVLATPPPPS